MELADFCFCKLEADTDLSAFSFCCGDEDLNEFLFDDAMNYSKRHLSLTYFFHAKNNIVAFFSLSHDVLKHKKELFSSRSNYKDFKKNQIGLSHTQYGFDLPAIKIGRLGISSEFQKKGLGTQLLDFIKSQIYEKRFAGCRLITVDAYSEALNFYIKNGFIELLPDKKSDHTTLMYFDLNSLQ